jgi:hypothetical protein
MIEITEEKLDREIAVIKSMIVERVDEFMKDTQKKKFSPALLVHNLDVLHGLLVSLRELKKRIK